jgi:uncharacterized membrane protein
MATNNEASVNVYFICTIAAALYYTSLTRTAHSTSDLETANEREHSDR